MRVLLALISGFALSAAADLRWLAQTSDCQRNAYIRVPGETDAVYIVGQTWGGDLQTRACVQKWVEADQSPVWSFILGDASSNASAFGSAAVDEATGDLIVGGWVIDKPDDVLTCSAGILMRLGAKDGSVVWSKTRTYVNDQIPSEDLCGAGTAIAGISALGHLVLFDLGQAERTFIAWARVEDGEEIARAQTSAMVTEVTLSGDGTKAFARTFYLDGGRIFAWDALSESPDAKLLWIWSHMAGSMMPVASGGAAEAAGGCVYAGCSGESCVFGTTLLSCTGQPLWINTTSLAMSFADSGKIIVAASIANPEVLSMDKWLVALTARVATTGEQLWRVVLPMPFNFPDGLKFNEDGSSLYLVGSDMGGFNEIVARVDASNGSAEWEVSVPGGCFGAGPILVDWKTPQPLVLGFGMSTIYSVEQA